MVVDGDRGEGRGLEDGQSFLVAFLGHELFGDIGDSGLMDKARGCSSTSGSVSTCVMPSPNTGLHRLDDLGRQVVDVGDEPHQDPRW